MKTTLTLLVLTPVLIGCGCAEDRENAGLVRQIAAIEAEVEELRTALQQRGEQLEASRELQAAKAKEAEAAAKQLQAARQALAASKADAEAMSTRLADMQSASAALKKKNAEKITALEAELAGLRKQSTDSSAALAQLRENLRRLKQEVAGDAGPAKTGSGEGVYQVVRDWPKYPEGVELGNLHGDMAADSQGNVYIAVGSTIQVIGADGVYKGDLGEEWGGVHGMKVREQGGEEFLFIAQNGKKAVSKLRLDGTVVWQILGHPRVEGMYEHISKYNPTDVDVAPDGTIYIADGYGLSLVHIYDKDRNYVKTFGGKGTEDGKFNVCHNVLVDTRGEKPTLLISDRQNNRLQLYSMDGSFIKTIDAELRQPCAADIHGDLLAVGELGGRMSLYGKDHNLIARLGDEPADRKKGNGAAPADWIEGALLAVHGCTFDPKGDLYAQEWNRYGRVTKYTKVK